MLPGFLYHMVPARLARMAAEFTVPDEIGDCCLKRHISLTVDRFASTDHAPE